jgi:chemotaxis protein histidine kinase CheA
MPSPNPVQTFLNEAEDLLARIEVITLELSPGEPAEDAINELFRDFHTLKGSGAMFGFDAVADFTHHVETVLDQARDGNLPLSEPLVIQSLGKFYRNLEFVSGATIMGDGRVALILDLAGLIRHAGTGGNQLS